jgi:5,10-methylenetetrahydromethanopterin reductase
VDKDHKKAVNAAKELLTQYLAQQPHIAKASETPEETIKKIQSILGWPATKEQIHRAMELVPDDLIERITASGTPDEVRAKVAQYRQNGCTCPILYPLGDDVKLMIDTFAQ